MNDIRMTIMEAIARRRVVSANYNGNRMTLAPHLLFERHGALYVSALNLGKSWRSDDERRLGHFKLDGLGGAQLGEETFEPLETFDSSGPALDDRPLLAV